MQAGAKEQTAFRFDRELIFLMKRRAKQRNISLNAYVTELIQNDLLRSIVLPKVDRAKRLDADILRFSGCARIPSQAELNEDERLARIWER